MTSSTIRREPTTKSVRTFRSFADRLTTAATLDTRLVSAMILATKGHQFRDESMAEDQAINNLLKADLSILWHPDAEVYARNAAGMRKEYAFVPDDQFREARSKILTSSR